MRGQSNRNVVDVRVLEPKERTVGLVYATVDDELRRRMLPDRKQTSEESTGDWQAAPVILQPRDDQLDVIESQSIGAVRGGLAPWQEKCVKERLRANLCENVSTVELASACGLSAGHFSRAFKQTVGLTPHQWLIHQRLELAKQLILSTNNSLSEIALAAGFVDQSHFTRVFSQRVRTSPAAWRRDRRREPGIATSTYRKQNSGIFDLRPPSYRQVVHRTGSP